MRGLFLGTGLLAVLWGCSDGSILSKPENPGPEATGQPPSAQAADKAVAAPVPLKPLGWSPDPELASQLGGLQTEYAAGFYRLQPPVGWGFNVWAGRSGQDGSRSRSGTWHHAALDEGVHATLTLTIDEPKKTSLTFLKSASAEELCALFARSVTEGKEDFKKDAFEHGKAGGLDFVRYRWIAVQGKEKVKGVFYLAKDGDRILRFSLAAPVPSEEDALRLMENTVLTVQKR